MAMTERVQICIGGDLLAVIERLAARERRTRSAEIRELVIAGLKARGVAEPDAEQAP